MPTKSYHCIVTPVAKTYKPAGAGPCSRRDYEEQQVRGQTGQQRMWDDAKGNPTKSPGGMFVFVENDVCAHVHIITGIAATSDRLPTWANNVGQRDRNVLYLSEPICTIPWSVWSGEYAITPWRCRGTQRVDSRKKHDALALVFDHVGSPELDQDTGEIFLHPTENDR